MRGFAEAWFRRVGVPLLVAVVAAAAAAHAAGGPGPDLTGRWVGSWQSNTPGFSGSLVADVRQDGDRLTGTVQVGGSPCFSRGTVSGTVRGNTVTFGAVFGGGQRASYSGTVAKDAVSGTYVVRGGMCDRDTGSFRVTKEG